jgi:hypothetical protein
MLGSAQRCGYPSRGGEHAIDAITSIAYDGVNYIGLKDARLKVFLLANWVMQAPNTEICRDNIFRDKFLSQLYFARQTSMAATPRELEVIELALRLCPESARIEELEAVLQSQFNFRFSRRTLQRNLHALISVSAAQSNQMVRKTGAGRATRYHLVASHQALLDTTLAPAAMAQSEAAALTEATIPLSTQGKYLQYLVQQPLSRRQP